MVTLTRSPLPDAVSAAIGASQEILTPEEQRLFLRLSVFASGFTLDAAQEVCARDMDLNLADSLSSMVRKRLLRLAPSPSGDARYFMDDTIRVYALQRLAPPRELTKMRQLHAEYYSRFAVDAAPKLTGKTQAAWLDRLEADHDNLRHALRWWTEQRAVQRGLEMAGALQQFWNMRGHLTEGRERIAALLELGAGDDVLGGGRSGARALALSEAGYLAFFQGDLAEAEDLFQQSADLARKADKKDTLVQALIGLGETSLRRVEGARARSHLAEALDIARSIPHREQQSVRAAAALRALGLVSLSVGDLDAAEKQFSDCLRLRESLEDRGGIAWALLSLGEVAYCRGNPEEALVLFERGMAIQRDVGDVWATAAAAGSAGLALLDLGRDGEAQTCFQESLRIWRDLGDEWGIALTLERLAMLASTQTMPRRALRLAGAAAAIREDNGTPMVPAERHRLDQRLDVSRQALYKGGRDSAWAEGLAMTLDQAVAYALEPSTADAVPRMLVAASVG